VRGDVHRLRAPRDSVGHEQGGTRLAVILQSDDLNLSTVLIAPTSTRAHPYSFRPAITIDGVSTRVMLDQLRAVDRVKAIGERVGRLDRQELDEVRTVLRAVLDIF